MTPGPLAPLLARLLRRDPREVERRARRFAIRTVEGSRLVARLGEAFLEGFNVTLLARDLAQVRRRGQEVEAHFRPFFFEGAAMGYLPRAWLRGEDGPARAERDLLEMDPAFRYLYYVGLGVWRGIRHPRRARSLERLAPHLDPIYLPLCADGFGFKAAFFGAPSAARLQALARRCPEPLRPALRQGFGRALYFVHMHDEEAFRRTQAALPADQRPDLAFGRALALGFTGVDRPQLLMEHVASAPDAADRGARLTGITWALTARRTTDADYLAQCLRAASPADRELLERLPMLCAAALEESASYAQWQERTLAAALRAHEEALAAAGRRSQAPRSA